jgi:hypothetical protein
LDHIPFSNANLSFLSPVSIFSNPMPIFTYTFRVLLLIGAAYLLWPPQEEDVADNSLERVLNRPVPAQAKIVFEFFPGNDYMPGLLPPTATEKLRGFLDVAEAFEARFPDTAIRFRQASAGREWVVTQLAGGTAPDILSTNVEDVWQDVHKGWYLPLDEYLEAPNSFAAEGAPGAEQWWDQFIYQAISRGKAAPDGKMYNLTYNMVETGILYNKTALDLLRVDYPETWAEMMTMLERIQANPFAQLMAELNLPFPRTPEEVVEAAHLATNPNIAGTFNRQGIKYPETVREWHTFHTLAQRSSVVPMLTNAGSIADWGTDLLFDQLYYNILPGIDLRQDPKREPYLEGYLDWDEICFLNQKGFFTKRDPRYWELYRLLKEWRRTWNKSLSGDARRGGTDLYKEFINQRGIMMWGGSWHVNRLINDPDMDFDWDVGYLPRIEPSAEWLKMTVQDFLDTVLPPNQRPDPPVSSLDMARTVDQYLRYVGPLPMPRDKSLYASDVDMCVIGGAAIQYTVTNSAFNDTGDPKTSKKLERVIQFLQFATLPEYSDPVVNENPVHIPNIHGVPITRVLEPFTRILERRYTTTKWMFTFDNRYNRVYERMLLLYLEDGITLDEFMDWQTDNLAAAAQTIIQRKKLNFDGFEKRWKELAPLRAEMTGIPEFVDR